MPGLVTRHPHSVLDPGSAERHGRSHRLLACFQRLLSDLTLARGKGALCPRMFDLGRRHLECCRVSELTHPVRSTKRRRSRRQVRDLDRGNLICWFESEDLAEEIERAVQAVADVFRLPEPVLLSLIHPSRFASTGRASARILRTSLAAPTVNQPRFYQAYPRKAAIPTGNGGAKSASRAIPDFDDIDIDEPIPAPPSTIGSKLASEVAKPAVASATTAQQSSTTLIEQQPSSSPPLLGDDWSKSYFGLSTQPFSAEVAEILQAPLNPNDIEMKPGSDYSFHVPICTLTSIFTPRRNHLSSRNQVPTHFE